MTNLTIKKEIIKIFLLYLEGLTNLINIQQRKKVQKNIKHKIVNIKRKFEESFLL
jgi:hypothetical protein